MKSFGEKLIQVANVSYLSYCKLNSVDPDVKKRGGPWTRSRWWSMDWGSVKCIQLGMHIHENGVFDSGYQMVTQCCKIIMVLSRNFRCFIDTVTKYCY